MYRRSLCLRYLQRTQSPIRRFSRIILSSVFIVDTGKRINRFRIDINFMGCVYSFDGKLRYPMLKANIALLLFTWLIPYTE
jgi:hypothetical protein